MSSILIEKSPADQALKKIRSLGNLLFSESTLQELQEILQCPKFNKKVLANS